MSNPTRLRQTPNILALLAFVIACVALFLPRPSEVRLVGNSAASVLDRVRATTTLRVGFEGYPPFAIQDPRDGSMSGYSVDLAERIARDAGWRIQWVQTSPDTKIADLKLGNFDVMVEPIFATITRAREVAFTQPYAYNGFASAIVRKGEHRFKEFRDIDRQGITVAVRQGYTDEAYAKEHLKHATVRSMNVDDTSLIFLEVISGKVDLALADTAQVKRFYTAHPEQVDMLFTDSPPAFVPAGFMLPQGDFAAVNFFNTALNYLESNGVLDELDAKYDVATFRPARRLE